jgi:spore coat polysaccharide biosynthesis protein SpsF
MPNIIAINQARTGSTRLPNKVLYPILGKPLIYHMMTRSLRASSLNEVVVATTTFPADDVLIDLCNEYHWSSFRDKSANHSDLLGLYYKCATEHKADVVVRITSDNPMLDPEIIDLVVGKFLESKVDYANNADPLSYPNGLFAEVMSYDILKRCNEEDHNPAWREHVTQYIRKQPEKFRVLNVQSPVDYSHMRWTVDTPQDLEFVRKIFNHYGHNRFTWRQAVRIIEGHPEWLLINKDIVQKVVK